MRSRRSARRSRRFLTGSSSGRAITTPTASPPGGVMTAATAPEGKHGRHSPSRAAGRDPVETVRFHNNSYANRVPDLHRTDGSLMARGNGRSALFRLRPGPNEKHAPKPDSRNL